MDKCKRLCERSMNYFQIYNEKGDVRLCGWAKDGHIGNIIDCSIEEVFHSESAEKFRKRHLNDDYSMCKRDACPYLAMGDIENHKIDYTGVPRYPKELYLGFEKVCNYACTCCTVHNDMKKNIGVNLEDNYVLIRKRIEEVLPYVTRISANGCGELFASKNTLDILKKWKPKADPSECSVLLETNGSLFDEKHWREIEHLADYELRVFVSVMSFREDIYRYLSGTNLPINNLLNNLRFISSLRKKGDVDFFEIATVVQEQNFREMPEFVKRALEEFDVDSVRLRPYEPWGAETEDLAWFKDIRNSMHPLYSEYKRVMSDPIFKDPRVHDWSGGEDAEWAAESPFIVERMVKEIILKLSLSWDLIYDHILTEADGKEIAIFGYGDVGRVLEEQLHSRCGIDPVVIDNYRNGTCRDGRILKLCDVDVKNGLFCIVTPVKRKEIILSELRSQGFGNLSHICNLINADNCDGKNLNGD